MRKLMVCLLTVAVLLGTLIPVSAQELDPLRRAIVESYYSDELTDLSPGGAMGQDSLKPVDISQWKITREELEMIHDELYYG